MDIDADEFTLPAHTERQSTAATAATAPGTSFFPQVTDVQDIEGIFLQNLYRVNFLTSQQSGGR